MWDMCYSTKTKISYIFVYGPAQTANTELI